MDAVTLPRRELTITTVALVTVARFVDAPVAWLVAGCVFLAVLLGTHRTLGEERPSRRLPLVTPALAAAGSVGAIHLVSPDLWLLPALAAVALLVDRTLILEADWLRGRRVARPAAAPGGSFGSADAVESIGLILLVAFVAFVGVAALVPNGLAEPAAGGSGVAPVPLPVEWLAVLALGDAAVAALAGFRFALLNTTDPREATWSAATYAAIVAAAAAAFRALALPRFVGPALLTLVVYLWSAYRGATPATRRSARWIWESVLLGILVIAVVAWNVAVRG